MSMFGDMVNGAASRLSGSSLSGFVSGASESLEATVEKLVGGIGRDGAAGNSFLTKPPLGAFGDVVFECSHFRVVTFHDWKRSSKGRYAHHDVIGMPPVSEFLGRGLEEISFRMTFTTALGVNPRAEAEKMRGMIQQGRAHYLVIGNVAYGSSPWVAEGMTEEADSWNGFGQIIASSIDVKLKEYIEGVPGDGG
ncbi:MAG: phage tail protein [Selenomonadaceae bacterium]|nr:phage tail protein [Selenomonadaceae bacterium]